MMSGWFTSILSVASVAFAWQGMTVEAVICAVGSFIIVTIREQRR